MAEARVIKVCFSRLYQVPAYRGWIACKMGVVRVMT